MRKFWKWKSQKENHELNEILERTLFFNGTIAKESWFDDVTPKNFKD